MRGLTVFFSLFLAVSAFGGALEVSWTDKADNEDGFIVERRVNSEGTEFERVARLTVDATQWTDRRAVYGVEYVYRVYAYNEWGQSGYSNEAVGMATKGPRAPEITLVREVKQ